MRIIFLDIDGVLNCQLHYEKKQGTTFIEHHICKERVGWLNELCSELGAKVVVTSTWRLGRTLNEMQDVLKEAGGSFEVISVTPNLRADHSVRGNEILKWIKDNEELVGPYYDYFNFVIIDDDSDMLLSQKNNFFQTDTYSGLTPTICYKITRFFKSQSPTE